MWPGMMPILISSGVMTPGQLGPMRIVFLPCIFWRVRIMSLTGTPSDANDEIELGVDRLVDRRGGERWRHIDDRHRRAGPLFGFLHGAKDRYAFELLPGLLRIDAGNVALAAMGIVA